MAVSVVEAMQLGLLPIVTKVGEVSRYCKDEVNSIIIGDINETVNRIEKILQSSILFDKLRKNAYLQWINVKNYSQSVEENCYKYISSFKK